MKSYFVLMRPRHYVKNLLVFVALVCSAQIFNAKKFHAALVGFIAFCALSSVVYIINDILDRERDQRHPTKCRRPIASGAISVKNALILVGLLLMISVGCNLAVGISSMLSLTLLFMYLFLNLGYSFGLKNVLIADVTILSAGFLIRVVYGACMTDIVISHWLYLTVISGALYFALGKRRNELRQLGGDHNTREVLKAYPESFLDRSMNMCMTLANVFYTLWTMDEETILRYGNKHMIFTVPFVLLITMKYSLDIEGDSDGDPVEVLFRDKVLLVLCCVYVFIMLVSLYSR